MGASMAGEQGGILTINELLRDISGVVERARGTSLLFSRGHGHLTAVVVAATNKEEAEAAGEELRLAGLSHGIRRPNFIHWSMLESSIIHCIRELQVGNTIIAISDDAQPGQAFLVFIPLFAGVEGTILAHMISSGSLQLSGPDEQLSCREAAERLGIPLSH